MDGKTGRGYTSIPTGRIFSNQETADVIQRINQTVSGPSTNAAFKLLQFIELSPGSLQNMIGEVPAQKILAYIEAFETELRTILPEGEFEKLRLGEAHLRTNTAMVIGPAGHKHDRFWLTAVKGENRPTGEILDEAIWTTTGDGQAVLLTDGDRSRFYNTKYPDRESELQPTHHRTPLELGNGLLLILGYRHVDFFR